MYFDAHSDIWADVTNKRLAGETDVIQKFHIDRLKKGNVEVPSDILGVVYKSFSNNDDGWKFALAKELKAAGYSVDMNNI